MQDLRGKDTATAIQILQQAGINPLVISVPPARNQKAGVVIKQDPSPGAALNTNSAVTLVVTSGVAAAPTAPATIAPRPAVSPTRSPTPRVP
jgi:beta-lactam-binding protein with PASTA domain